MKRIFCITLLIILFVFVLGIFTMTRIQAKENVKELVIVTGPIHASSYFIGASIAKVANKYLPEVHVTCQTGLGGVAAMRMLAIKSVDFSPALAVNTITHAYMNIASFEKDKDSRREIYEKLRYIFGYVYLYANFITTADSGIRSIEDLRGKRVCLGHIAGSALPEMLHYLLMGHGLDYTKGDYKSELMTYDQACNALIEGTIDAASVGSIHPNSGVTKIILRKKVRFIGFNDEGYSKAEILLPGMYPRTMLSVKELHRCYGDKVVNTEDILSGGAIINFGTYKDMDEDLVYKITKVIWEHESEVQEGAKMLESLISLQNFLELVKVGLIDLDFIRLHPGAAKYYREIGVLK